MVVPTIEHFVDPGGRRTAEAAPFQTTLVECIHYFNNFSKCHFLYPGGALDSRRDAAFVARRAVAIEIMVPVTL